MTTRSMRRDFTDRAGREIQREWDDLDVVDADKELRVFILPEDIQKAVPKDEENCVFAQACRRTFKSSKVMFWRSVAYIELPDEKGNKHVERFLMPAAMRSLVESFDRGEGVIPEAGFSLGPVPPNQRFENQRKVSKEHRERRKRKKLVGQSKKVGKQGEGKFKDDPITLNMAVRCGTGAVHFRKKKKDES